MRNCENCGLEIPDDAISCDYCGQKVSIKTHRPTDKTRVSSQDVPAKSSPGAENNFPGSTLAPGEENQNKINYRDVEENQTLPSSPASPTPPNSSAKNRNPVILALLIVTVIFALVLGGVIAAYSYGHPTSTVTPTPVSRVTITPVRHTTPTPSPVVQLTPTPSPQPTSAPTVNVSPSTFSQTGCPQNSDASWTCTATVTETAGSQSVNWSVTSSFSDVTFTPLNGSVSIGNPNKVSITIPANDCQNGTFTFNFTEGVHSIAIPWNCVLGGGGVNGCSFSYTAGQGWPCTATVFSNADNLSNVYWSTNSTGVSGITFTPPNGVLPPNQSMEVIIFVPDTVCPASASLNFSIGSGNATIPWSCPTPTLNVSPTSLGPNGCISLHNGNYQCMVTLSDDQGGAKWTAISDLKGVTFDPSSGTVYPSGETVTITVGCVSANFTFTGPGNSATVSWQCIP